MKEPASKTGVRQRTGGSNPSLTAKGQQLLAFFSSFGIPSQLSPCTPRGQGEESPCAAYAAIPSVGASASVDLGHCRFAGISATQFSPKISLPLRCGARRRLVKAAQRGRDSATAGRGIPWRKRDNPISSWRKRLRKPRAMPRATKSMWQFPQVFRGSKNSCFSDIVATKSMWLPPGLFRGGGKADGGEDIV